MCVCLYVSIDLTFIPTVYQHISLRLSVNLVNVASEPSQVTWSHHTEEDKETSTDRSRLILSLPKVYLSPLDHSALPVVMFFTACQAAHMAC